MINIFRYYCGTERLSYNDKGNNIRDFKESLHVWNSGTVILVMEEDMSMWGIFQIYIGKIY